VASGLDTRASGTPIVVYNPLGISREEVVEATVPFASPPRAVRVVGPDGRDVPAQLVAAPAGGTNVLFLARLPSVGFAVFDVQPAEAPATSPLMVTTSSLENTRYRVRLDANGDVSSIFDKALGRELLQAPARLAFQTHAPVNWPAWNMDWADQQRPPRGFVTGRPVVRITEDGPVRVAIEVTRESEGSRFVQTIRLAAGDAGNRVEFANVVDWRTSAAALKAVFPLTAANAQATYNWDVGTIQRGNNDEKKYEVPSHQWFDLTDVSGTFGVTVLSDCKYGSDKPSDGTLRLALIYTPGIGQGGSWLRDQATQDWGRHEIVYGLAAHAGDWRQGQTDWQAQRLNQPLVAFSAARHGGGLGRGFSLLGVSSDRVRVLALKRAENSDEYVVRLVELDGRPQRDVRVQFAWPVTGAREVNGAEEAIGSASIREGVLVADFDGYQPRTYAVTLADPPAHVVAPTWRAVALPFDRSVASGDRTAGRGGFDAEGRSLPAEMLPTELEYAGVRFTLNPGTNGTPNAVTARGQTIALPPGTFSNVYVLAASAAGDRPATFLVGDTSVDLTIQDWSGYIGQWDNRTWTTHQEPVPRRSDTPPDAPVRMHTVMDFTGLVPGYIKRAPVAWFASHRHTATGANEAYAYAYLYAYSIDVPAGASAITLPDDERIRVLAVTAADGDGGLRPAQPLYDTLEPGRDVGAFRLPTDLRSAARRSAPAGSPPARGTGTH
jgi:alpha-mannosidase